MSSPEPRMGRQRRAWGVSPIPFVLAQVTASCSLGVSTNPRLQGDHDYAAAGKLRGFHAGCATGSGPTGGAEQGYLSGGDGASSVRHEALQATCMQVVTSCHALGG